MSDEPTTISRREFAALSLAAGLAAATRASGHAAADLLDTDVQLVTPAGVCDAALIHPRKGAWPGVILCTDVFGLRPTMRDMAKRLAADGYTVLVPNPFYRTTRAPGLSPDINFNNPADRAKIDVLRAPLTADAVAQDAAAYVAFLDAQAAVSKQARMGVFGYCMGGPMALRAAAANPGRIGAGASFHGGGLVTERPDSPHLLVANMRAQFYFGIAMNDDQRQPDVRATLDHAFKAAALPVNIDVYDACLHGWCVPDMPVPVGKPAIYNATQALRAWAELLGLFRRAHLSA